MVVALACRGVCRIRSDTSFFLLPYLIVDVLMHGEKSDADEIYIEICAVLCCGNDKLFERVNNNEPLGCFGRKTGLTIEYLHIERWHVLRWPFHRFFDRLFIHTRYHVWPKLRLFTAFLFVNS
jgi:hypothetical protein